jgi:intracellular multiplication protein IcmO
MAQDDFRGPDGNAGVPLQGQIKDIRTPKQKFAAFLATPDGFLMTLGMCVTMFIIFPAFGEIWALITAWVIRFTSKQEFRLPFRIPKTSGLIDPGQINPGTDKPEMAEGITFFGNERKTKKELWFNNSDMRTHILIFGSTGAGKTESLLSLAYNSLVQGSGLIYVDGKGENVLYTKVFSWLEQWVVRTMFYVLIT